MKRDRFSRIEAPRPTRDPSPASTPPRTPAPEEGLFGPPLGTPRAEASKTEHGGPAPTPPEDPSEAPAAALFAPSYAPPRATAEARFNPEPPPLVLAERDEDTLPFRRCLECGVDSNRFAARCSHCGVDLDTPSQLAFQQRIAEEVRSRREAEAADLEAKRQEAEARAEELTAARREMAAQLALAQRRSIERDLGARGIDDDGHDAVIDWLLSLFVPPHHRTRTKWIVALLALLIFVLTRLALDVRWRSFGVGVAMGVFFSFIPRRAFGRHRHHWW